MRRIEEAKNPLQGCTSFGSVIDIMLQQTLTRLETGTEVTPWSEPRNPKKTLLHHIPPP